MREYIRNRALWVEITIGIVVGGVILDLIHKFLGL